MAIEKRIRETLELEPKKISRRPRFAQFIKCTYESKIFCMLKPQKIFIKIETLINMIACE